MIYNSFRISLVFVLLQSLARAREIGNFYQDLTELIDNTLQGKAGSRRGLEKALTKSTFVFYSTDLLLNDIASVEPVLNLLNHAKPRSSRYYLMLSFRYTNNNRFDWRRIDDIYYSLTLKLSPETKNLLTKHLTSIVLDWRIDVCQDASAFFAKPAKHHAFGFEKEPVVILSESTIKSIPYSFPNYVQNFLKYYLCATPELGNNCTSIPVGIAYNSVQIPCMEYIMPQFKDAEFLVMFQTFPTSFNFPYSYNLFRDYMTSTEASNEIFLGEKWEKGVVCVINIDSPPSELHLVETWRTAWKDMEHLLSSSEYFIEGIREMIVNTHKRSVALLETYLFLYTLEVIDRNITHPPSTSPGGHKFSIIFGNRMVESFIFTEDTNTLVIPSEYIIPHLYTDEIESSPCSLRNGLASTGSGELIVNIQTWRAIRRLQQWMMDPRMNCTQSNQVSNSAPRKPTKVTILFGEDEMGMWDQIEKHVVQLINTDRQLGIAQLETLAFPERGIFDTTLKFVSKVYSNYSVGCVVNFDRDKLEVMKLKAIFTEELRFRSVMRELCGSIFETVDTFIWNMHHVSSAEEKEIMVLARHVFLMEFPDKSVWFQFPSGTYYPEDFVTSWSMFYQVPVAT